MTLLFSVILFEMCQKNITNAFETNAGKLIYASKNNGENFFDKTYIRCKAIAKRETISRG